MFARFCVCSQTLQRIGEQTRNHENSRHHQPKKGAGKTTVAIHLAVAAEQRGLRTAVFDLDPQASATSWSDRRNNPRPAVAAAQPPRLANLLEQAAAQSADLVLIDSAPNADAASLAAARVADLILIPCRPAAFDLDAIGTTLNLGTLAANRRGSCSMLSRRTASWARRRPLPCDREACRWPCLCITWSRSPMQ